MDVFDREIERILMEVYYKPISGVKTVKRAVVSTDFRYIEYLIELSLIKRMQNVSGGRFAIQLTNKGHEVFEKYKGWDDYKKKVVLKRESFETSKMLAMKFWWLPISISLVALIFSIIAIFK